MYIIFIHIMFLLAQSLQCKHLNILQITDKVTCMENSRRGNINGDPHRKNCVAFLVAMWVRVNTAVRELVVCDRTAFISEQKQRKRANSAAEK